MECDATPRSRSHTTTEEEVMPQRNFGGPSTSTWTLTWPSASTLASPAKTNLRSASCESSASLWLWLWLWLLLFLFRFLHLIIVAGRIRLIHDGFRFLCIIMIIISASLSLCLCQERHIFRCLSFHVFFFFTCHWFHFLGFLIIPHLGLLFVFVTFPNVVSRFGGIQFDRRSGNRFEFRGKGIGIVIHIFFFFFFFGRRRREQRRRQQQGGPIRVGGIPRRFFHRVLGALRRKRHRQCELGNFDFGLRSRGPCGVFVIVLAVAIVMVIVIVMTIMIIIEDDVVIAVAIAVSIIVLLQFL
mmetsp:Transcript_27581/g.57094  ORF Transcript_27581/g.57094 Transcript_27581/m.57094 type:complete len:299 (+) Transcript_27581:210-1106(+)